MDKETRDRILREFGERVKKYRIQSGLTQDQLAEMCGFKSRSSINKIELGKADMTQSKIILAADAMRIRPVMLFGDFDELDIDAMERLNDRDRARLSERASAMLESESYEN